jgi:hypothetical protein
MNTVERRRAEDRLLESALREVLGVAPAPRLARRSAKRGRPTSRWLVAAVLVLGVGAVVYTASGRQR